MTRTCISKIQRFTKKFIIFFIYKIASTGILLKLYLGLTRVNN